MSSDGRYIQTTGKYEFKAADGTKRNFLTAGYTPGAKFKVVNGNFMTNDGRYIQTTGLREFKDADGTKRNFLTVGKANGGTFQFDTTE